ncbi:hypothetical protein C8R43DRAFT_5794 [Mycena crocata]|nr:hypothetical protein C8R43DRAFT_5794 [Mycena crocata]
MTSIRQHAIRRLACSNTMLCASPPPSFTSAPVGVPHTQRPMPRLLARHPPSAHSTPCHPSAGRSHSNLHLAPFWSLALTGPYDAYFGIHASSTPVSDERFHTQRPIPLLLDPATPFCSPRIPHPRHATQAPDAASGSLALIRSLRRLLWYVNHACHRYLTTPLNGAIQRTPLHLSLSPEQSRNREEYIWGSRETKCICITLEPRHGRRRFRGIA